MSAKALSDSLHVDQAADHKKYRLLVTAGTSYDPSTHRIVPVNAPQTLTFETSSMIISLAARIRNFTGFPRSSPQTSSYFEHPNHKSDQYSISFSFLPKTSIPGTDLVFGNDFDRPIKDRLPPGFNQAFKIVKWFIDPGLEGDVYAEQPYLYGSALSSWNALRIGDKIIDDPSTEPATEHKWKMPKMDCFHETVVEEGADGSGERVRREASIPADPTARKRFFLNESHREAFTFEAGRLYQSDFGNPHLDFNEFSLKLPGFSLNVLKYVDSKTHELRYTLKNKRTDEVYAVVLYTLLFGEDLVKAEKDNQITGDQITRDQSVDTATNTQQARVIESADAMEVTGRESSFDPPPSTDDLD